MQGKGRAGSRAMPSPPPFVDILSQMTRLTLVLLVLVPAALAASSCPITSCDYNLASPWTGQVCGQLSADGSTYVFNPTICSNSTENCQFTNFQSDSVCVSTDVVQVFDAYPGEKCTYLHGCASGNCVDGTCTPFTQCQNYYDCGSMNYCSPGVKGGPGQCLPLIADGSTPCYHTYECMQNMACDQAADGYPGFCRNYLTVRPGDYVKQCGFSAGQTSFGRNYMCTSSLCYNFNGGYRCTDNVASVNKTYPVACNMGSECWSEVDGVSGLPLGSACVCSFNKYGQGYCQPNPGDPNFSNLLGLWADYMNSTEIMSCNTYSRPETNQWQWCLQSGGYKHYWKLMYHETWLNYYPEISMADDCYLKYVAYAYWQAEKYEGAAVVAAAALFFLL